MNERVNELTYERIKQMPTCTGDLCLSEKDLNIKGVDSKPLWEIDAIVESKAEEKTTKRQLITEGVLHERSPWLKTIQVMNERFYKYKGRAENSNFSARAAMNWAEDIEKRVDKLIRKGKVNIEDKNYLVDTLQEHASNKVYKEISEAKPEKLDEWRTKGARKLLKNILVEDSRFNPGTKRPDPVGKFVEKRISPILESKPDELPAILKTGSIAFSDTEKVREMNQKKRLSKIIKIAVPPIVLSGILYLAQLASASDSNQINVDPTFPGGNPEPAKTQTSNIKIETPIPIATSQGFSAVTAKRTPEPIKIVPENVSLLPRISQKIKAPSVPNSTREPETKVYEDKNVIPATPEPDYYHAGIDFSNDLRTTINIAGVEISSVPVVFKDSFTPMEAAVFTRQTASGTDRSQVYIDEYGNTIWSIHSGTDGGKSNPAEELRKKIQIGSLNDPFSYLNQAETLVNINKLLKPGGDPVYIEQEDGTKRAYQIVAVGVIPDGNMKDEFYSDKKNSTDNAIKATGGINSSFNVLKEKRGIMGYICLHNVSVDPNNPDSVLIDQTGDTLVIGLIPTDESYRQNEAETAPVNHEAESKMHPLERSARILTQIIKSASSRIQDSGQSFEIFVIEQLKKFGVAITPEMSSVIHDAANETLYMKMQCTIGADLLGTMPGSEGAVMDTYGWQDKNGTEVVKDYNEAVDFITRADDTMDPILANGGRINRYGAEIFKVDSFGNVEIGDKITVPRSPALPEGHVVVVIGKWLDENGTTHLKIFDVNYERNFGLARILEDVTEENIYEQIAKGQNLNLFVIRPQEVKY